MQLHSSPLSSAWFIFLTGFLLSVLYVALKLLVDAGAYFFDFDAIVALPFLPAGVRVLGFLLIGLWISPFLYLAFIFMSLTGLMIYPGLGMSDQLILGVSVAIGGPVALCLLTKATKISVDLLDLTPLKVLIFASTCAAGNALFYNAGLMAAGFGSPEINFTALIFVGDILGVAIFFGLLYAGAALLKFWLRSARAPKQDASLFNSLKKFS